MVNGHWAVSTEQVIGPYEWPSCVLCRVHGWLNGTFIWITVSKYRTTEPRYLWYCGTKKYRYRELHGTGTVKKLYTVVPWYRPTLVAARGESKVNVMGGPTAMMPL